MVVICLLFLYNRARRVVQVRGNKNPAEKERPLKNAPLVIASGAKQSHNHLINHEIASWFRSSQ
jgi:hypothetical protein